MNIYYIKEMIFVNGCKKTLVKLSIYSAFIFIFLIVCILPNFLSNNHHSYLGLKKYSTDIKYILFWVEQKSKKDVFFIKKEKQHVAGQNIFIEQNCKDINCFITYDRNMLRNDVRNFDAIVFNIQDVRHIQTVGFNLTRSPHQRYIFKCLEPSAKYPVCDPFFDNFFNWTWSYKLDSDIPQPLINIYDKNNSLVGPKRNVDWAMKMDHTNTFKNHLGNKNKAIAWIISKCKLKSKHNEYVKELKNELKGYNHSIDSYGPCGDNKCPGNYINNCYKIVEKSYFFHLVIEDYFAEDYVSEKVVKTLTHFTVPIVLGGANYTSFLPPGSYINARAFDLKKLGAIINYLIKNPDKYNYFLDWKNHYFYTPKPRSYMCDLCTKLNSPAAHREKTYPNFRKWWNPDYIDYCTKIHFLKMFSNNYLTL